MNTEIDLIKGNSVKNTLLNDLNETNEQRSMIESHKIT